MHFAPRYMSGDAPETAWHNNQYVSLCSPWQEAPSGQGHVLFIVKGCTGLP